MSTNASTNGEELFDHLVKQELDKTIEIIRKHNLMFTGVDTLPFLNEEQKIMFVNLVKLFYGKLVQSLNNNQTNETLIKYDTSTRKFIIPTVEDNLDGTTKKVEYKLSVEQFIETIIRAIVIAVFRLDGKNFFTTSLDDTSALINDATLSKAYTHILSFVLNEMLRDPNFASGLTVLADNVATGTNTSSSPFVGISNYSDNLPRPKTPDGDERGRNRGWPSDKRGGKTNRKRKYKSRSKSRSNSTSKKRKYKSRKHSRSRNQK
jgi:hypothetical protein